MISNGPFLECPARMSLAYQLGGIGVVHDERPLSRGVDWIIAGVGTSIENEFLIEDQESSCLDSYLKNISNVTIFNTINADVMIKM